MSFSDTRFFTNEGGSTLLDRFNKLTKDAQFFDCLVGYFYASGFAALSKSLEKTEKIRVLIGLSTDKETYDYIQEAKSGEDTKIELLSHRQVNEHYKHSVRDEMEKSDDTYDVETGVRLFIEWIRSGKLKIRVYRSAKIHAKLYIMSYPEGSVDDGRVITGSSNFSKSGLVNNLEFNVELKDRGDYDFASKKFEELWKDAVDVSEDYVATIQNDTWLSNNISPYELYLKFLYEYLKEQINQDMDRQDIYLPDGYMDLQYQKDAVTDAMQKLLEYGGVFISDVVGLGKTYITAMLLRALNSRALVLAPPILVDRNNPGSWPRVLEEFRVPNFYCESVGKLDQIPKKTDISKYEYVVIDESHKFRNENNQMYDDLYKLCVGKKVILVTATPLNNSPADILSQIKLFQPAHASTLPNPETRDLEAYFSKLQSKLHGLDRQTDKKEYLRVVRENAEKIRKDILQYLMVRRTRASIAKYYTEDLEKRGLHFPEVADPSALCYNFDENTDDIFNRTIERIVKEFRYARYKPLLYLINLDIQLESGQKNMVTFMRVMLLKRLESSFYAFNKSLDRMIGSYEKFIGMYRSGVVYTNDGSVKNLMTLLEEDNFDKIDRLISEGRVQPHNTDEFVPEFLPDLEHDLQVLQELKLEWSRVKGDPKLEKFIKTMRSDQNLKDKKVLIFTEAKETADYLTVELEKTFGSIVLSINGSSKSNVRQQVIDNFDGKVALENQADDFRILVTTEVMSEGVNLHRSNVVVNYDIPWNPTRMIQRVGRINRVDTKFDWIYIYNFFPAGPINDNIGLEELAIAKIEAFIEMLGNDAKLLTDEEIKSHDLFRKLKSAKTITGEDEEEDPELKYLALLRDIRDDDIELFERIKSLPKKVRVGRKGDEANLITFFRREKVRKIFQCRNTTPIELDFAKAAKLLEAEPSEKGGHLPMEMFEYLGRNKEAFNNVFLAELAEGGAKLGNAAKLRAQVSALRSHMEGFTDDEIEYVDDVLNALDIGTISKKTTNKTYIEIKTDVPDGMSVYRWTFMKLKKNIDYSMIQRGKVVSAEPTGIKEVILSEYFGV